MSARNSNRGFSRHGNDSPMSPSSVLSNQSRLRRQSVKNSWKDYLLPQVSQKFKEIKRASEELEYDSHQDPRAKLTKVTSADRFTQPSAQVARLDVIQQENQSLREQLGYLRDTLLKLLETRTKDPNSRNP